jgi:tripeptide aminopeptidase
MINNKRLLETFVELLKIESPSKSEKQIVSSVSKKLKNLGAEVYIDNCGKEFGGNAGNIIATYKPKNSSGSTPIFLGAHLDTVKLNGSIVPIVEDGKIVNEDKNCILGGDNKVAVAAIIEALSTIKEKNIPTGNIYIIFTVSEEIGLLGAKHLNLGPVSADYGFVFDSDGDVGSIVNKAPYHNSIYSQFIGKAAHAGVEPEKGINSIKAASIAISNVKVGRIDKETTCNIGKIEGGVATNIVPERTKVETEVRSIRLDKLNKITKLIIENFGLAAKDSRAKFEYKIKREYDGFEILENEIPIIMAKTAIENLGIKHKVVSSGGGSDINIFNSKGKRAVNLSAGMENVHTSNEYVKISQLEKLAELIVEICKLKIN